MPQNQFGVGPSFNPVASGPPAIPRSIKDDETRKKQNSNSMLNKIAQGIAEIPPGLLQGLLGQQPNKENRGLGDYANIIGQLGMAGLPMMSGLKAMSSPSRALSSLGRMEQSTQPIIGAGISPSMMPADFAPIGGESIYNTLTKGRVAPSVEPLENLAQERNIFGGGIMPPRRGGVNPAEELSRIKDYRIAASKSRGEVKTR